MINPRGPTTITCRAGTRASGSRSAWQEGCRLGFLEAAILSAVPNYFPGRAGVLLAGEVSCAGRPTLLGIEGFGERSSRAPDFPPGLPQLHDADGRVRPSLSP